MGSGKTNWAIQYMNENPDKRFMYLTPYNDEIQYRIIPQCPALNFKFAKENQKVKDFKEMLEKGRNIAATHECFKRADDEVDSLLEANNYILILDEVFDVVIDLKIKACDVQNILDKYATVENDYLVWTDDNYPDVGGRFSDIKQISKMNKLMVYENALFLWLFPVDLFKKFDEVYVMTYLFAGQTQKYYFDANNLEYEYYKVEYDGIKYKLVDHDHSTHNNLKPLIDIYDGNLNDIGNKNGALCVSFWNNNKNKPKYRTLQNNIYNFFRNIHNAKSDQIIWTCFKDDMPRLKGDGYAKGFVECNCRATNKYGNRTYVAYCVNRFMRTVIKQDYFAKQGIKVDEELFALAEMLQFIWRSAIRNGLKIHLYIPSSRMRGLLNQYLNNQLQVDYTNGNILKDKAS